MARASPHRAGVPVGFARTSPCLVDNQARLPCLVGSLPLARCPSTCLDLSCILAPDPHRRIAELKSERHEVSSPRSSSVPTLLPHS